MSAPRRPDSTDAADGPERDAWLTEALRHAPDAQAAPPPALSESILRQARAATRGSPAAAKPRGALAAAWAWLVRPPVAASFASLLVATTVGVMWWDRPLDETLARPPAAVTSPPPAAAPEREVAESPPADAVAPPAAAAAPREQPALPKPPARRPESKAAHAEPQRARRTEAAPEAAPEPTAPPPVAAPAPAPAPASSDTAARANLRDESRPPEAALFSRIAPKAPVVRPPALAALLDSVATEPERWTWQRSGAIQPMNPALQRWLVQVDNAAAARWRSSTHPVAPPSASVLRLYRDGTLTATLRLTDDAVWLAPASQAALPGASITALKQALDEAAP